MPHRNEIMNACDDLEPAGVEPASSAIDLSPGRPGSRRLDGVALRIGFLARR